MDLVISLLAAALTVIALALAVARIRARKRLDETQRKLLEARREFGNSLERLFDVVLAQNSGGASRRSSQNGSRLARSVSQSGRAAFCGGSRRYGSTQSAYRARRNRIRFAESYRWEDEWASYEDDDA